MLHIDDIRKRLSTNPEPKEVTEMRKTILKTFSNVHFQDEGHIYTVYEKDGTVMEKLPSASTIIRRFEPYVDWELKAEAYALKYNRLKEDVQREWKEANLKATNSGSLVHLYGENMQKWVTDANENFSEAIKPQYEEGFLIPNGAKEEAVSKFWEDVYNKMDKLYPLIPECVMYMPLNNIYGIDEMFCGTADITFAYKHKGEWCIVLWDYKTNGSLVNNYNRNNNMMMLPPFDNMVDESISHYTIQLSLYSMMLENIGYKVIDRQLIWLKDDKSYEKIKLPYIKDKIIESFKKN